MSTPTPARTFTPRHLQAFRALFFAIAALMVMFSQDHSAGISLKIFAGFAIATALIFGIAAWLIFPSGEKMQPILMAVVSFLAGIVASITPWTSAELFFWTIIVWALLAGVIEIFWARARRQQWGRGLARDGIVIGSLSVLLAPLMAIVPVDYALEYFVKEAKQTFVLTGMTIGSGLFGGFAAIAAVYLGIAAFSPKPATSIDAPGDPQGVQLGGTV